VSGGEAGGSGEAGKREGREAGVWSVLAAERVAEAICIVGDLKHNAN
jgi:hypothetical protein